MQCTQTMTDSIDAAEMAVIARMQTKRLWFVAAGIAVMVVSFVFAWVSAPYHSAETRILIEDWGGVNDAQGASPEKVALEYQALQNQFGIISSAYLLRNAGAATHLFARPGASFSEDSLKLYDRLSSEAGLLANLRRNLTVTKAENSRIISIKYLATDPALAMRFANALADSYVALLRVENGQESSVETTTMQAASLLPASARVLSRSSQTQTIRAWWTWPSLALGLCGLIGAIAAYVMPGLLAGYKKQIEAETEIEPVKTLTMPVLAETAHDSVEEMMVQELDSIVEAAMPDMEAAMPDADEPQPAAEIVWKETRLAA